MSSFDLQRLGQIMEPEPGNPMEVEGVLYYGMADSRIGVARLNLPDHLPPGAPADTPAAAVNERDGCAQEES